MSAFPWKAVAWDIDGTLVDSEPLHHRALVAACGEHGLDLRDLPEMTFIGIHLRDVWEQLRRKLPETLAEAEFHSRVNHHYIAGADRLGAIAGAAETIRALDAMGVAQVCASNSARNVVDANLAAIGVTALMRGSISLDDVVEGKPAPESYLRAARLIDIDPTDILVIEDSQTGVRAACAAGMQVALLSQGAGAPHAEADTEPHFRIAALGEILRLSR
ncbi:HAD family phosphatase [Rhizobium sp. ARZ01]|uniref:HAD family hydrolase n=1 Tax=Rhizobium sp. ARZ01 TaxID=2769313 RepID=UPI00177DF799|nr:HAD family phosphatase [Rhizobium sp. ARZ01]MBD9375155.1 HAD family phosphatase [Rhizobium sp. ARZ01]